MISDSIKACKHHLFYKCFWTTLVNIYTNSYLHWQWIRCQFHQHSQLWILWIVSNLAIGWEKLTSGLLHFCFPDHGETQLLFRYAGHLWFLFCELPIYIRCPILGCFKHLSNSKLLWLQAWSNFSPIIYQFWLRYIFPCRYLSFILVEYIHIFFFFLF